METPHANNQPNLDAERLSDILTRVGKYVEAERSALTQRKQPHSPEATTRRTAELPLAVPNAALTNPTGIHPIRSLPRDQRIFHPSKQAD